MYGVITANCGTALATSIEIKSSSFLRKREDGATNDGQAEQDLNSIRTPQRQPEGPAFERSPVDMTWVCIPIGLSGF